jgi:hypothetical protein
LHWQDTKAAARNCLMRLMSEAEEQDDLEKCDAPRAPRPPAQLEGVWRCRS